MDGKKARLMRAFNRIKRGFGRKPKEPLPNLETEEKATNKKIEKLRLEVLEAMARLEQMDIEG